MPEPFLALPDKPQAISIEEAFDLLTPHEFTLWMRLSVMSPMDLASGRTNLAKMIGYSKEKFDNRLRGLTTKGFVRAGRQGHRQSVITILYAAAIVPPHHFVNFS